MMRDLPIFFLILAFAAMLFVLSQVHLYQPVVSIEPAPVPELSIGFTGRVVMPSLDDIYVLDNSAGRDLFQFERYLQGRAAGLHFASAAHFKNKRANCKANSKEADVLMGIKLTLDSLGSFAPEILFSNTDDENFKGLVLSQIQTYWRYTHSVQGKLVAWVPIAWKSTCSLK